MITRVFPCPIKLLSTRFSALLPDRR